MTADAPEARPRATTIVFGFVLMMAWLLVGALSGPAPAMGGGEGRVSGTGDTALYKAVVARVRAGEGYYDAAGAELRARHYPVRPVFNWRQPTYAWLLAGLPSPLFGSAILVLLGAAVVWSARAWLRIAAPGLPGWVVVGLMTVTMSGAFVRDFVFMQEAWAGTLIVLAVCLFGRDRWKAGVAASLAALAFRELALLPCAVGLLLALRRRRWPEVGAWVAGLAVYAALMAWHFAEVTRHYQSGDLERGWLARGGAAFVLDTCKWNPLFVALPSWAAAVILPFAMLSLAIWPLKGLRDQPATLPPPPPSAAPSPIPGSARAVLIVLGYVGAFAIVGNPFNDYWGAIYAPLLTLGLMGAPASVRDLVRALRSQEAPAPPAPDR